MECNKDEAVRSREIAVGKFLQHDLAGAKKFALKAQHLFPDLDGLPQFIAMVDVHTVAQDKVNGVENNWYGILQVDAVADDATIRKQYRRLALLLHPDKNKSVGAEAAFKLISEAWGVLSDKAKKAAHDARRNANIYQSGAKVTQSKGAPGTSNGFYSFTRSATTKQSPPKPPPKSHTFWTACPACKMQFEYLRIYENQNLCCPTCHKPFLAREVPVVGGSASWHPPEQHSFRMSAGFSHPQANVFTNGTRVNAFPNGNFSWGGYRNPPADQAAAATATAEMVHQTYEKVRRERVEAQKEAKRKEQKEDQQKRREKDLEKKVKAAAKAKEAFDRLMARAKVASEPRASPEQTATAECKMASESTSELQQKTTVSAAEYFPAKKVQEKLDKTTKNHDHLNDQVAQEETNAEEVKISETVQVKVPEPSKLTPQRSLRCKRNHLNGSAGGHEGRDVSSSSKKARVDVQVPYFVEELKEHGFSGVNTLKSYKLDNTKQNTMPASEMGQTQKEFKDAKVVDANKMDNLMSKEKDALGKEVADEEKLGHWSGYEVSKPHALQGSTTDLSKLSMDMDVPDPDFYDFDKDRTELHFSVGQIWAVYDDDDGMPRYYARISRIFSVQPFKVQMSWLEARSPSKETSAWLVSGFSYSCGEFKLGKPTVSEHVNTFSHLVRFEKGQRGAFRIYPQKGDIWAMYKGWNALMKAEGAKHEYEMVAILTDFSEEVGVRVAFLVKVGGFKTVFQQWRAEAETMQWISPKELLRFSHQVPAHQLVGGEVSGVSEDCWELDPASTPTDLINGRSTNWGGVISSPHLGKA